MSFLISDNFVLLPDSFLENYTCSNCHKFLSVKPIKVYQNKQIKCGRCINTNIDDGGTCSMFENLAKGALFKCINRFDGCRALLTFNGVAEHEEECLSKNYECPICIETKIIPTFNLIRHFKQYHTENILQNCHFNLDNEILIFKKIFLYKIKDYLFFICVRSEDTSNVISLEISILGEEGKPNIHSKMFIRDGNISKKVSKKVLPLGRENKYIFECAIGLISIAFDLEIEELIGKINTYKINPNESLTVSLQRKLFVETKWLKYINLKDIVPFCFVCSEIFTGSTSNTPYSKWSMYQEKFYYVCLNCLYYFKKNVPIHLVTHIPFNYNNILYYCVWNCKTVLSNKELKCHEIKCRLQPKHACPVISCRYEGRLDEIYIHFSAVHKNNLISLYFEKSSIIVNEIGVTRSYFCFNGVFVLLKNIANNTVHDGFCIHNIDVIFCKKHLPTLKLLWFCNLDNKFLVPVRNRMTVVFDFTGVYYKEENHSLCNNIDTTLKICIVSM